MRLSEGEGWILGALSILENSIRGLECVYLVSGRIR